MSDSGGPPADAGHEPAPSALGEDDDLDTSSLEGGELDELLAESRQRISMPDGETAQLSGEETDRLLRLSRESLGSTPPPEEPRDEVTGKHTRPAAVEIADDSTVERLPEPMPAPTGTLPMPKSPVATPPAVPLSFLAPPVAIPTSRPPSSRPPSSPPASGLSRTLPLPSSPPPAMPPSSPPAALPPPSTPPGPMHASVTETPIVVAQPLGPARAPMPSAELPWRPERRSPLPKALLIAAVVAGVGGGLYTLATHESDSPPVVVAPAPPPPPKAAAPPEPAVAAPDERERAARDALAQLRNGMRECVRRSSMVLPGSSPPIPGALKQANGGGYTPVPNDWKTPVWSCATFKVDGPMRFQVQWQLTKGSSEGLGVAWLDDDGDGRPDRAFGFHATLRGRGQVDVGEVAPMDASHAVIPVSY